MIIWRGKGIVIALIAFGCALVSELATRAIFAEPNYYQNHGWPKLLAIWAAAALVYSIRSWLGVGGVRTLVDKSTGAEVRLSTEAQLFLIPARYWPLVLLACGVALYFVRG